MVVIVALGRRPARYTEPRDTIGGIGKDADATRPDHQRLVERRVLRTAPPGAEYRLTDLGHSLLAPVSLRSGADPLSVFDFSTPDQRTNHR